MPHGSSSCRPSSHRSHRSPSRRSSSQHSVSHHSPSSSGSDDEDQQVTIADLRKRKRRQNKKAERSKKQKGEFDDFRQFAQWYMRSENAFIDFGHVLTFGLRYEDKKFGKLTRERFVDKHYRDLEAFFAMREAIDDFDDILPKLSKGKGEFRNNLAKLMNDAASGARGNDIKDLCDRGLVYIALDLPPGQKLDISPTLSKQEARGHNHVVLSRLLCPVRFLEAFDKEPEVFRKKILRGDIKFNDEDFPSMLYPQPNGYDPDDIEANLLRNQTAVRYFKHLFTSPKSAMREPGLKPKRRTGQANLNNMEEVTPGSIAYSMLMFWYNISAIGDWREDDDLTDRTEFYGMVLDMFDEQEDDEDSVIAWRNETLDWWNYQVFGTLPEKSDDESDSQIKATTLQLLREQRAKKAAAAAAITEQNTQAVAASTAHGEASNHSGAPTNPSMTTSEPGNIPPEADAGRGDAPSLFTQPDPFFLSMRPTPPPSSPPPSSPPPSSPPPSSPHASPSSSSTRQPLSPARAQNVHPKAHNLLLNRSSRLITKLNKTKKNASQSNPARR